MQLQHGRLGGVDYKGVTIYDAVFTQCKATAAVSQNAILVWNLSPTPSTDLGYQVTAVSGPAALTFVGRADHDAVAGETVLVQCYGVGTCLTDGNTTSGTAQVLDTNDGQLTDRVAEDAATVVGIAMETDAGTPTVARVFLKCM